MNLRIKIKNIDAKLNSILESVFNYFPNLIPSSILDLLASVLPPPFHPPRFAQVTNPGEKFHPNDQVDIHQIDYPRA